jgi:DNA repair exonuclease SbcCD ATPase subunit
MAIADTIAKLKGLQPRSSAVVASYQSAKGALADAYEIRKTKIEEQERLQKEEEILQQTMQLFKNLSEEESEKSKNMFISLVNYGLHSIFGDFVSFDLDLKVYATGVFYGPVLIKNGKREDLMSSGGGILDIVSFLCRIVVLVAFYPRDARVLRLDEPFKNLSAEYRPKAIELMSELSKQFDIQLLIVTHLDELAATPGAKIFKTTKKNDRTQYTELKEA